MIKRETILARVRDLAKLIHDDYKGRRPVLLCVLKGANPVGYFQSLVSVGCIAFLHKKLSKMMSGIA